MQALLDRLDKQPVTVEVTHSTTNGKANIKIGKLDLQLFLTTLPGRVARIKFFPATFAAMNKGDFSALAQLSLFVRRDSNVNAMSYLMDCASHGSPERLKRIQREAKSSLVGSLMDFPFPDVCEAWGARDAGPLFRSPVKSNLPVLFISGTLDGRTPVSNAEEIRERVSQQLSPDCRAGGTRGRDDVRPRDRENDAGVLHNWKAFDVAHHATPARVQSTAVRTGALTRDSRSRSMGFGWHSVECAPECSSFEGSCDQRL